MRCLVTECTLQKASRHTIRLLYRVKRIKIEKIKFLFPCILNFFRPYKGKSLTDADWSGVQPVKLSIQWSSGKLSSKKLSIPCNKLLKIFYIL